MACMAWAVVGVRLVVRRVSRVGVGTERFNVEPPHQHKRRGVEATSLQDLSTPGISR